MEKEIKFIKNAVKQLEKYKSYLTVYKVNNGVQVFFSKYNTLTRKEENKFNSQEVENFLTKIIIDKENNYFLFDHSSYVHPIKNLIKSLKDYKLDDFEQENILNKFFTFQNTHDFIAADYTNDFLFKYVKSEDSKNFLKLNKSFNYNTSLYSLSRELLDLHKKIGQEKFEYLLQNNLKYFVNNYEKDEKEDKHTIDNFSKLLIEKGTKELYEEFFKLIKKPGLELEKNIDVVSVSQKKEYVLKLDLEKIENNFILFKNPVAKEILNIFLVDFFNDKNKDLHEIENCEVFTNKDILTVILSSSKEVNKELLKKDISFIINLFDKKLNYNDLPSSTYSIGNDFKENLINYARNALMHKSLNEKINNDSNKSKLRMKI